MILEISYDFLVYMWQQHYYLYLNYIEIEHIAYSYEGYGNLSIGVMNFYSYLKRKRYEFLKESDEVGLNSFIEEVNDFLSNCRVKTNLS